MSALMKRPELVRAMNSMTMSGVKAWWMRNCQDGFRLQVYLAEDGDPNASGVVVLIVSTQGDGTHSEFTIVGAATPEEIDARMRNRLCALLDEASGF